MVDPHQTVVALHHNFPETEALPNNQCEGERLLQEICIGLHLRLIVDVHLLTFLAK